ncbi:hypothetical protein BGX31_007114 [Mortierella sp. GBA43]|nr:hypothetical protein BGX31_007114 [Mortierella sp. GBA43]
MVTIPKMIGDIQHLTQHFGWKRINLAGISMGAIISQQFAANYADKVTLEHLVLMSSGFKSSIKSPFDGMVAQWLTEVSQPPTEEQWNQFTDKLFQACLTPEFIRDQPERVKGMLKAIHEAGPNRSPQALLAQSKANSHYDFTKLLKKIRVPTLVLHGTKDIVLLPENGRKIHAEIKGSKYIEYPDGGHILFETDPQSVLVTVNFVNDKE